MQRDWASFELVESTFLFLRCQTSALKGQIAPALLNLLSYRFQAYSFPVSLAYPHSNYLLHIESSIYIIASSPSYYSSIMVNVFTLSSEKIGSKLMDLRMFFMWCGVNHGVLAGTSQPETIFSLSITTHCAFCNYTLLLTLLILQKRIHISQSSCLTKQRQIRIPQLGSRSFS